MGLCWGRCSSHTTGNLTPGPPPCHDLSFRIVLRSLLHSCCISILQLHPTLQACTHNTPPRVGRIPLSRWSHNTLDCFLTPAGVSTAVNSKNKQQKRTKEGKVHFYPHLLFRPVSAGLIATHYIPAASLHSGTRLHLITEEEMASYRTRIPSKVSTTTITRIEAPSGGMQRLPASLTALS